jgi:AmpD protein
MNTHLLSINDHLINEARFVASPNFNVRPVGCDIDLIVIHNISLPAGQFGTPYVEQLFCNSLDCSADPSFADLNSLEVSSHLLIKRDGELVQFVPFDQRAWHAGVSSFNGRSGCNDFSIGIELEGCDEEPYADPQYATLNTLINLLRNQYPRIERDAIVGHSEIAPGRKTDPGPAFDWSRLEGSSANRVRNAE